MKKLHLLTGFVLFLLSASGQTSTLMTIFDSTIKKADADFLSGKKLVSPQGFQKLSQRLYSRVPSNAPAQSQPGSYASLKLTDNSTVADLQTSFFVSNYSTVTVGFNAVVSENIADLYSGKDGLNADWGIKLGWNKKIGGSIFYSKEQERQLNTKRKMLLYELPGKYQHLLNETYKDIKTGKENIESRFRNEPGVLQERTAYARVMNEYRELTEKLKTLDSFYTTNESDPKKVEAFINDKIAALELEEAAVNGFSSWVFNLNAFYNRKGFKQFFPSALPVNSRFADTAANNYGFNIGISYFRNIGVYQNFNASLGLENKSNFELAENQKYNRTYTTQMQVPNTPAGVSQYSSTSKKAFDSASIVFKTFTSIDLKLQYTLLFGKAKAFGFNTFANYSNSKYYSVPNKMDIGFGPVISLTDKDKTSSKLNFSLFGSLRNLFDSNLTTKEKFVVSFNVSVPFNFSN